MTEDTQDRLRATLEAYHEAKAGGELKPGMVVVPRSVMQSHESGALEKYLLSRFG